MQSHLKRYEALCHDRPYLSGREPDPKNFALLVVYADRVFNRTRAEVRTAWTLEDLESHVVTAYKQGAVETVITSLWTGAVYAADLVVSFKTVREPAVA